MNPYFMTRICQNGTRTYLRTVQHGKLNGFGKESFATMTKTVFVQIVISNMTLTYYRLIQIKNIPNIIRLQKKGGEGAVREFSEIILHFKIFGFSVSPLALIFIPNLRELRNTFSVKEKD